MAMGEQAPEVVGDGIRTATAKELRTSGLPPLGPLGVALRNAAQSEEGANWDSACHGLRRVSGDSPFLRALAAEGVRQLEVNRDALRRQTDEQAASTLIEGALERAVDSAVFGSEVVTTAIVGQSSKSIAEVREYQRSCVANAGIETFGRMLIDSPSEQIRAPRSQTRASTNDLLDQDLG